VTFVNDDQVKKVTSIFPVEARSTFIFGNGLVDGKVHLPALNRFPFDFHSGFLEGSKVFVLLQAITSSSFARLGFHYRQSDVTCESQEEV